MLYQTFLAAMPSRPAIYAHKNVKTSWQSSKLYANCAQPFDLGQTLNSQQEKAQESQFIRNEKSILKMRERESFAPRNHPSKMARKRVQQHRGRKLARDMHTQRT